MMHKYKVEFGNEKNPVVFEVNANSAKEAHTKVVLIARNNKITGEVVSTKKMVHGKWVVCEGPR